MEFADEDVQTHPESHEQRAATIDGMQEAESIVTRAHGSGALSRGDDDFRQRSVKLLSLPQTETIRERLLDAQRSIRRALRDELLRLRRSAVAPSAQYDLNDAEAYFTLQCLGTDAGLDLTNPAVVDLLLSIEESIENEAQDHRGVNAACVVTRDDIPEDVDWEEYFSHLTI
mmetsp:Transcript_48225/g.55707  ORF Transcript_48225/g.55707 Transcript_48225/m.55707 type:complete len:172 (-) Transcript_48225:12-527(-)